MPRIRNVKPEFFTDSDICEQPPLHRLLYVGLWCHADRDGRLEDKPRELKVKILPYDDCNVDAMLFDLHGAGFVIRYQVDGVRYLCIPKFPKHQKFNKDEKPRGLPGPEAGTPVAPLPHPPGTPVAPLREGAKRPDIRTSDIRTSDVGHLTNGATPASTGVAPAGGVSPAVIRLAEANCDAPIDWGERMDAVFREATGAVYSQTEHQRRKALTQLMQQKDWSEEEALRRWRRALSPAGKKRKSVATWLELAWAWNHFAGELESPSGSAVSNPGRGGDEGDRPACAFPGCGDSSDAELFGVLMCNRHVGEGDRAIGAKRSKPEVQAWLRQSARKAGAA